MINMKMSPKEAKEWSEPSPENAPAYPYGLCIYLNDESLKKLGFTTAPAAGAELTLQAKVVVTSCGMNQQQDGDQEIRCDLQITDMELAGAGPDASAMYSNSGMNP